MSQCPACRHDNRPQASFCDGCGAPLELACAKCGTALRKDARFCDGCGTPLGASTANATPEPRSYTPKHLADKILASRSALEGERKQVTVLFVDVKSSMDLSEQVGPEEWHRILERFFEILAQGVHRLEGTVNQYTGDGIMALFGAPIAHEDHAQRACYAALHLRDALRSFAQDLRRNLGFDLQTRIGLNSGDVVVGRIGDDLRMDYTAQGHTVGLAQRMEQLAEAGRIYLAPETARLVAGYFALADLGEFRVKGSSNPLHVFELEGIGQLRTRFDVSRARGFSRFVGRTREMTALAAALEAAREGSGAVIGVVAQAGTGKSRLCFEFLESCRASGIAVHEGRAVAHGKHIPLIPILEIFRSYFGIGVSDDARTAREKIAGRLVLLDGAFREVLPVLFEFLGVADPAQPAPLDDAHAKHHQLLGVARRLLQHATTEQPAVLFIEDLHWLDSASEGWLADWVDAAAGTRTMLLLNYRPEFRADWMARTHVQQLALAPLTAAAMRELIADLLGADPSLDKMPELIFSKTGGNPFFVEEVVQSLIESGALAGARGSYRLATTIEQIDVPATVQALLASRIDRLDERDKRVLTTAAVIGRNFRRPLLEAIIDVDAATLTQCLARLKAAEFVYEESLYPIAEYAFKHPVTQEVAYASHLSERRKVVHARVASALAATVAETPNEHAALLAHHFEAAGDTFVAAQWHRRAAQHAGLSRTTAMHHNRRVRDLALASPQSLERDRLIVDTGLEITFSGQWAGLDRDEISRTDEETLALARALGDRPAEVALQMRRIMNRVFGIGDINGAFDEIEVLRAEGAVKEGANVTDFDGAEAVILRLTGLPGRAARALRQSLDGFTPSTTPSIFEQTRVPSGLATLVSVFGEIGAMDDARRELARLEEHVRQDPRPATPRYYLNAAAIVEASSGNPRGVLQFAGDSIASDADSPNVALEMIGVGLLLSGDARGAVTRLEELRARAPELLYRLFEPRVLANLAFAYLEAGEIAQAESRAVEGLRLCREHGTLLFEPLNLIALARVRIAQRGAEARDEVNELFAQAEQRSVVPDGPRAYLPRILEARAELALVLDDGVGHRRYLERAHRLYVEMGAVGHAERLAGSLG